MTIFYYYYVKLIILKFKKLTVSRFKRKTKKKYQNNIFWKHKWSKWKIFKLNVPKWWHILWEETSYMRVRWLNLDCITIHEELRFNILWLLKKSHSFLKNSWLFKLLHVTKSWLSMFDYTLLKKAFSTTPKWRWRTLLVYQAVTCL